MEENQSPERATYRPLNSWKKKLNRSVSWRERLSKGKEAFKGDLEHLLRDKFQGNHGVKMARKRERIICEIFTTERKYQNQLAIIVEHFLVPLGAHGLIPSEDHRTIFENVTAVQAVNRELLCHMEEKGIPEAFIQLAPFMKVYCTYANNFEKASQKLQEWERKRASFVQFLREQESKPECTSLSLHALLITPIQRIPRYKLLLEELLNNTPENHEEYNKLKEATARMTKVTYGINEYIREHENFQKMLLIQNSLTGSGTKRILAPGRRFIREGTLMKVNKKGSGAHERMFFLFNDLLIYAKPNLLEPSLSSHSYSCRGIYPLEHCQVQCVLGEHKISGTGALFKVVYGEENLLLYSTNHNIALSWMDALQGAIQQIKHKKQSNNTAHTSCTKSLRSHNVPLGKLVRNVGLRSSRRKTNIRNYAEQEDSSGDRDTLHPMRMQLRSTRKLRGTGSSKQVKSKSHRLQRGPLAVTNNKQEQYGIARSEDMSVSSSCDVTSSQEESMHCSQCQPSPDQLQDDTAQQAFCVIL
ncbi:rho guanine nucleotide exchange factor 39-like [Asterias rubens]|uniref:rho guanine nucleotide exchange factor 39-like n=1 Tax=Asterias rubens TaxID=7604 RepID=UPI00145529C2|nr:rho guanine nucleotide exchange factor 39-like [Asterias rubens]XP_033646096.1 rho guanine nucleotide exchange factor 39-like [Asterias rubens]